MKFLSLKARLAVTKFFYHFLLITINRVFQIASPTVQPGFVKREIDENYVYILRRELNLLGYEFIEFSDGNLTIKNPKGQTIHLNAYTLEF